MEYEVTFSLNVPVTITVPLKATTESKADDEVEALAEDIEDMVATALTLTLDPGKLKSGSSWDWNGEIDFVDSELNEI